MSSAFLLAVLLCGAAGAIPQEPEWHIVKTKYATTDTVVAGFNVLDFGAKGDGQKDCTQAFQTALDRMKRAGGGTVFVPEGKYAIKGNLSIPESVTLRGEWQAPSKKETGTKGTVLMAYAGKGQTDGKPFITVDFCAGIKEMTIWYPEQSASKPVPYPFCLIQKGGDNATFENLTLVNPYQGIRIGPGGNELHYVHNVFGTPLKVGVQYDSTTDIGRLENINFSPAYWITSGLSGSPAAAGPLEDWLMENGTGLHMFRSDWEYVSYINVEGYNRGFFMSEGVKGAANAQFYFLLIKNCATALEVEKTNPFGMVFTKCMFEGTDYGIRVSEKFDSAISFSNCYIGGRRAIHSEGNGCVILQRCIVTRGDVAVDGGTLAMTATKLRDRRSRIGLGPRVVAASLAGCELAGGRQNIVDKTEKGVVEISDVPVELDAFPFYDGNKERIARPAKDALHVVEATGDDDTDRIQQALDKAGKTGGGIVFLPAGNYLLKGQLSIPTGVELRGIHDVPHHTKGGGSIIQVYPPDTETPTIVLNATSGIRGMSFNYPEQRITEVKDYPFLLQGKGKDIYVIHVNCANPFRFLDLMSHRCDNHYVDYISGAPLKIGIAVGGGSMGGEIRNTQFNPHYWGRNPNRNKYFSNAPSGGALTEGSEGVLLWTYQKENLDAMVIGHCTDQFLFQNFVYGSLYGIHYTKQNGNGPVNCISHGHGTDGSKVGVYFEHGDGKIAMVNSELVAMSSENKTAIKLGEGFTAEAALFNTMVWGRPDLLAEVDNGHLLLQSLHCTRHGEGIKINRGHVRAVNANFASNQGSHLSVAKSNAKAEVIGCITSGELLVDGKRHNEKRPGNIKAKGNIHRPAGGKQKSKKH